MPMTVSDTQSVEQTILHRTLSKTPSNIQQSPKKDMSPNEHQMRGPSGKYVSASEKARKTGGRDIFRISRKATVLKVESDEEDSDFECYN